MDKSKKALLTTMSLTLILFGFIVFLLYVIYCYAYYDKYQEQIFTDSVNNGKYDFVYEKMVGKGNLTYEQFISGIEILKDKDGLINIFNTYYKDSGLYNEADFIKEYLFTNINIESKDIKFTSNGKTNLFTRRAIFYDEITLSNGNQKVILGAFNKVMFKIENNAVLRFDNRDLVCENNICIIDKIYGGIYEISYISNGYEYYGLVNINKDKQNIDITNLESLVKVRDLEIKLSYGKYNVSSCISIDCPEENKSYMMLNEDGTFYSYRYYSDKGSASIETGNYTRDENKLMLAFKNRNETYLISGTNLVDNNGISYLLSNS